ncbi:MAG: single-stranded-DNA-specific exonuclease [Planctomycetota bacterium]|jgi:single-stranded-DNA-specific exonuclease
MVFVPSASASAASPSSPGSLDLPGHWNLHLPDPETVLRIARSERIPEVLAQLAINRGHADAGAVQALLAPTLHGLNDPASLPDMAIAAERLERAAAGGETILIHGDYDVDGVSGTVLLVRFLRHLGAKVEWHIPHRTRDGYSFGDHSVVKAREVGASLVISVDNGTSANEPIATLVAEGVDVIVTDHHEPPAGELPPALALVNPKLPHSKYPFRELCGSAVAFKLAWAVCQRMSGEERVRPDLRKFLLEALGYVAIATICDVVPLIGENRILAHFGLRALAESPSAGMRALLERTDLTGRALTAEDVGFQIGPRINASGRMDSAARAVETLLSDDPVAGRQHAETLEKLNDERRAVERGVVQEALEEAKRFEDSDRYPVMVLSGQGWHPGVVGIVASRIVDRFHRPTLIIGVDENGIGRGSARSIPGVSVLDIMRGGSEIFTRFGGHEMAAGCEIQGSRIDELREAMVTRAHETPRKQRKTPIDIDAVIDLESFDESLMSQLLRLEPCGQDNPGPVLMARDVRLEEPARIIGADRTHMMLQIRSGRSVFKAMAFGMASREPELKMSQPLEIVFKPRLNHWRGRVELQLVLEDFRSTVPQPRLRE